ncbi:replication initiator protein A [Deinococcus saxicola]|uniref:replication initiator protein A n=1 Tax=Deinococcus TaxID=1298 RepID=UPI0006918DDF|nr:replication initiator protein A [Deinococcus marmoris]
MHQGSEPFINEITLARSGVFSILNREDGDGQSWKTTFSIGDRFFHVQGVATRGRPHGVDPDVLLALQTLFFEAKCPDDDTVECTAYALLKLTPMGTRGNAYSRLRDSLLRLEGVSWLTRVSRQSEGRFRGITETNRLIDRISVQDTSLSADGEGGTIEAGAPLRVTFSRHFAESIRAGMYQILDAKLLSDLKQPTARSLYRVLQAHRVGDDGSLARELPVIMAAWREATGLTGQRSNNVKRTLDGAHAHLIAAKYLRDVNYKESDEGTRITYEFTGEVDPELVRLLTDMKVTRPVAEALVSEHADRIQEVVKAMKMRLAQGYKPNSLGGAMVHAVRNPDSYIDAPPPVAPVSSPSQSKPRTKAKPEAESSPLSQAESVSMICNILKLKLGRAPRAAAQAKLAALPPAKLELLAAASKTHQADLVAAVHEAVGEAP